MNLRRFIFLVSPTICLSCTNILVTLTASDDGTVLLGDNDDSAKRFGGVTHFPAAVWPEGSTRAIYDFETGVYVGEIPQPEKTFNVMGGKNKCHFYTIFQSKAYFVEFHILI